MQRWEIAGISAWPVVEALLALNIHGTLGISEAAFLKACIGMMTVAAIARAMLDARKKASTVSIGSVQVHGEMSPEAGAAIAKGLAKMADREAPEPPADAVPSPLADATTKRMENGGG